MNDPYSMTGYVLLLVSANDLNTHLLSIERTDWPSCMTCDAKTRQHTFPVGFQDKVCVLDYLLSIDIFHDVVARIESRCESNVVMQLKFT